VPTPAACARTAQVSSADSCGYQAKQEGVATDATLGNGAARADRLISTPRPTVTWLGRLTVGRQRTDKRGPATDAPDAVLPSTRPLPRCNVWSLGRTRRGSGYFVASTSGPHSRSQGLLHLLGFPKQRCKARVVRA